MKTSSNHSQRLCPSVFVAALIFSVFTLTGIVSAAWVDAPNEPPAYGASGCSSFPCLEADFRPVNLSATEQTKRGPLTVDVSAILPAPPYAIRAVGDIVGNSFKDSQDQTYFIDPATTGGYAGLFNEKVGIRQRYPNASFTVNNDRANPPSYENSAKAGSIGDAIYAYANSSNAAIAAEQGDPAGYAVYSSGGINYFGGDVQVGSAIDPKQLCINDDCKSAWPNSSGGGVFTTSLSGAFSGNYTYNAPTAAPISLTVMLQGSGASNSEGSVLVRWKDSTSTVIRGWTKVSGTNIGGGNDGGSGMTDGELATIPFITGSTQIEFSNGGGNAYTGQLIAYTATNLVASSSIYDNGTSIGIGTATPQAKLEVAGQIKSSIGGFVFPDGTTQTSSATFAGGAGSFSVIECDTQIGDAGFGNLYSATCPPGKELIFYAEGGHAEHNTDWNNNQYCTTQVGGNFSTETIYCNAWANGAPGCGNRGYGLCL